MHIANRGHQVPVGIECPPVKTVLEQTTRAPGTLVEPTGVRQKQPLHRRAHTVLIVREHQMHEVAH